MSRFLDVANAVLFWLQTAGCFLLLLAMTVRGIIPPFLGVLFLALYMGAFVFAAGYLLHQKLFPKGK